MFRKLIVLVLIAAVTLLLSVVSCSTVKGIKATKQTVKGMKDIAYETQVSDFDGYEKWMKVNKETITGDVFGVLGPAHAGAEGFREVYINKTGKKVSTGREDFPYPMGTIIVKESYTNEDGKKGELTGLTVMIKRGGLYDPDNGNWEYMMVTPENEVMAQGRVEMCIGCHAEATETDWVFNNRR